MALSSGGRGCRLKTGCVPVQRCDSIIACCMNSTMLVAATGLDDVLCSVCALKLNKPAVANHTHTHTPSAIVNLHLLLSKLLRSGNIQGAAEIL